MGYSEKYPSKIEIPEEDMSDLQKVIIEGFIREGSFRVRDALISSLESDISSYLSETSGDTVNLDWVDGVRYAIHIIREAELDDGKL